MSLSNTQKGIISAFIGYTAYTISDSTEKLLGQTYEVTTILFWVYAVILAMCLTFSIPTGVKKTLGTKKPVFHLARGIFTLFISVFAVASLAAGIPLATLYTVVFLSPTLTSFAAIFIYREKVSKHGWTIIFLGFAGIVVAFHKNISLFEPQIIYAFGVLIFGTAVNLMARPIKKHESLLVMPFYPAIVSIPMILLYEHGHITIPDMKDIPLFILAGASVFTGITGVMHGFRIGAHAPVASVQYSQMLLGIVLGYFLFGDIPGAWMLIGAGMIIASGLLLIMRKK